MPAKKTATRAKPAAGKRRADAAKDAAQTTTSATASTAQQDEATPKSARKAAARKQEADAAKAQTEADADEPEVDEEPDGDDLSDLETDDDSADASPDADAAADDEPLSPLKLKQDNRPVTQDSLRLYLAEVSRFPMLKPEEEFELARRVRDEGDSDAAFRLVSSHLRLVVKIAMDFQRRWMQNVLDLVQEGNVGLMRAVQKFDPDKGIKFSYYAAFWIKAYILKFIMDNWRMVKIGTTQSQRKLFYNLNKERRRLQALGYDPDAATLSKNLNVSREEVEEMEQRLGSNDMSLDVTLGDDSTTTRLDVLPAIGPSIEDTLAKGEIAGALAEHIETILPSLNEKERDILEQRLLADPPATLREIGEKYNISRERVRQLEARLLGKLREHLSENIEDFSSEWIIRNED